MQAVPPRPHTWRATKTTHAIQTQDTMEQEHQDDDARGEPATPSTPTSTTTQGGKQRPADPDGLGSPRSREHAPGTPPPRPSHMVYSEHQEPTTQGHTNHDPGTANTTGPQGGEMIGEGATRRQLEPEPDQTPSQHTDYSANATNRTASTTTRQRTPSQYRTEYSQNTNYSHIPRRDTNDPEQDPNPSQHTDYSNQTTN